MDEQRLSLEELALATGLTPRNIRSYIAMQLLRGPEGKGRAAFYTSYHRERLLAVRALMEREGLTLGRIGATLARMTPDEIQALASTIEPAEGGAGPLVSGSSSAAEYLRSLGFSARGSPERKGQTLPGPSNSPPPAPAAVRTDRRSEMKHSAQPAGERHSTATPIDQLAAELGRMLRGRSVPRQSRGEPWFRIPVTPDIELSIRGALSEEELARLERIADYLRQILLGGLARQ